MTEEVRKMGLFFADEAGPMVAVIGGSIDTLGRSLSDRILLLNSMLDSCEVIVAVGAFGMQLLRAVGIGIGEGIPEQSDYTKFCQYIVRKAQQRGVRLVLPTDFVVCQPPQKKEPEGGGEGAEGEEKKEDEAKEEQKKEHDETKEGSHWVDIAFEEGPELISLNVEERVARFLNPPAPKEGRSEGEAAEGEGAAEAVPGEGEEEKASEGVEGGAPEGGLEKVASVAGTSVAAQHIPEEKTVVEFGEETVEAILGAVRGARKVFWDGSVSLFPDT